MNKEFYYDELVTHVPNLMNAYGRFQHQSEPKQTWSLESELERGQHIYEFTAHLNNADSRTTELQFGLDKMCSDFHSHLSRLLLGNNWGISKNLHKQPMMICFFDHEGTKQRKCLGRSTYPHIHGLMVIHATTLAEFKNMTEERTGERRYLMQKQWAFREVSFKPVYDGIEGLKRFVDYSLKFDKTNDKSGNNIYTLDVYPQKNKDWNTYLKEISEGHLRVYH